MSELSLIARIRALPGTEGIGDDCAVLDIPPGRQLLLTTDFSIEGVHFLRSTHTPGDCGWKALARGLSDIAAMGGDPRHCFVSLALAPWTDERWVQAFYRGLLSLARRESVTLAGGDLTRAHQLTCDIVVTGTVPRGKALLRSGAKPGNGIYVSGKLGGSALGLRTRRGAAWKRHLRPEPRLALGRALRGKASAAMDLTDGLALDLHRLCLESGVAAALNQAPLPLFPGATLRDALSGGEDYELLFTLPSKRRLPLSLAVTRIGTVVSGPPGSMTLDGRPLAPKGWDPL